MPGKSLSSGSGHRQVCADLAPKCGRHSRANKTRYTLHCEVSSSRKHSILVDDPKHGLDQLSQGVSRTQALAGNTVNSRVSQRLRPAVSVLADPLGLRPATPSSSRRRKLGWLSLTWVSR